MDVYGLTNRPALLAAGVSDNELARWCARGDIVRVARGAYLPAASAEGIEPAAWHALEVRAALERLRVPVVASHVSAAVLHGVPTWGVPLDRVHLTRISPGSVRRTTTLHLHGTGLAEDEVDLLDGCRVTSVARTVVDVARTEPFEQAVAIADAALRAGLVAPASLAHARERARHRAGATAAGRVVAFADGRAESVGESRSRVALRRYGLPTPELQWEVRGGGRFIGRVDFGWPALRTIGEFDGRTKYTRDSQDDAADVVWAEKRREDALRAVGLRVVRWTWADLSDFGPVVGRLRSVFAAP
ncbi:CTP synthase [Pseudonocardia sulfidoxydans NBRC 16205]|uniref:CTP synthase n=1 Tax=Pseudonocardia sulfidoxydans NBRC 16205 TaxID=1223511 RepID=A0A511DK37_9PSEU|nr:type IV toxin-antitoxin system AbiEi family antitoxin domain-containing protein [Pseudonocardia sulfidoxydans]GEL24633.1 CTP synthase [Pseudonocardia sulfidoxydans NBRC 16205]